MATEPVLQLTLYSRSGCHLCEQMKQALQALRGRFDFAFVEVNVDADAELARRYGEDVPVLVHRGRELARHRLESSAIADYLAGAS